MTRTITEQEIQEQKRETQSILRQAEKRVKKPIRKIDTWSVQYIVAEKKKGHRKLDNCRNGEDKHQAPAAHMEPIQKQRHRQHTVLFKATWQALKR